MEKESKIGGEQGWEGEIHWPRVKASEAWMESREEIQEGNGGLKQCPLSGKCLQFVKFAEKLK